MMSICRIALVFGQASVLIHGTQWTMIETCVRHIHIPSMLETQGTACLQIYKQRAHSSTNLRVSYNTDVSQYPCSNIWNVVNNYTNRHPPNSHRYYAFHTLYSAQANIHT